VRELNILGSMEPRETFVAQQLLENGGGVNAKDNLGRLVLSRSIEAKRDIRCTAVDQTWCREGALTSREADGTYALGVFHDTTSQWQYGYLEH
jgi:hypothetical protein